MRWTHLSITATMAGMELYFSPLACSLASRVALYEAGVDVTYIQVDPTTKRLPDGADYRETYGLGLVPALRTPDGVLLTENAAVLQYIDTLWHDAPRQPHELRRWLSFIGTELHKGVFAVLFDRRAPTEAKAWALAKAAPRLAHVDAHLRDREYLLDALSVADAYLYTVLNWTQATPVDLTEYPALRAFQARMAARPQVARAFKDELPLYRAEQAARAATA